ncbi:hypothetical protein WN51_08669 [Melipona quadrifasciata]|uniref:CD80-like immunoglobulin C2-set domain-containing protein n=1 Tax=Melipona quadrifasciata TaxID=166423 RepID=A0A0M9A7N3_9HYME|nr:hypothetical protein WN51_08669 [Melipona quadrifasciata]
MIKYPFVNAGMLSSVTESREYSLNFRFVWQTTLDVGLDIDDLLSVTELFPACWHTTPLLLEDLRITGSKIVFSGRFGFATAPSCCQTFAFTRRTRSMRKHAFLSVSQAAALGCCPSCDPPQPNICLHLTKSTTLETDECCKPRPRVTWFLESQTIDAPSEIRETQGPGGETNVVTISNVTLKGLTRSQHRAKLFCKASNTHLAPPSTTTVTIELHKKILKETLSPTKRTLKELWDD